MIFMKMLNERSTIDVKRKSKDERSAECRMQNDELKANSSLFINLHSDFRTAFPCSSVTIVLRESYPNGELPAVVAVVVVVD